ncbi:YccF domain-containing protein [Rhizobium sp. P38BS-XIX]|uniref:YccF domain-containing protein n=1 Tax=Rhizobium sp. P38BS-XIX TaxID=2726740 RepID=UPI001FF01953|nr:YccF domain-containing protein [Rhizobium sp. P38BS-XIX]
MRFVGNIIWFVFGGAILALLWLFGALIFAVSIIGLPISRGAIEMAKLSAFPFGKDVVHVRELDGKGLTAVTALTGTIGFIANIVWAIFFGSRCFSAI